MIIKDHFGNPMIEQRALFLGEAVCALNERGIIEVSGEDRLSWLHSLLSQNLKNLKPGESAEALLLDPQGHIEVQIHFLDDGHSSWLIVEHFALEKLLAWLTKMVFRMRVVLADRSSDFVIVGATKKLDDLAAEPNGEKLIWQDPWPGVSPGGYRYSTRAVSYTWFEHLIEKEDAEAKLKGFQLAGTLASEALRISAGRPAAETELDEKSLPHELDLLSTAVHLSKGCYRGQESVAKVHNLGHPPRRLTFLHLDGSGHDIPKAGDEITVLGEERVRGHITSSAQHFEMGPIALALLQRSVPEDATLSIKSDWGEISASQEVIVPASAGAVANIPKLPRLNLSTRAQPPRKLL